MSRTTLACSCLLLAIVAGCGGGSAARDGAVEVDGAAAGCPELVAGEKRKLGGCCVADADCSSGLCWNGFCTTSCTADQDCTRVTYPSPFPVGTEMHCASNQVGETWSLCLPGSGRVCTEDPSVCPSGESCVLGVDPLATSGAPLGGLCLARFVVGERRPAGASCDDAAGPYQCEDEGGLLGNACRQRSCTRACKDDRDCPGAMRCSTPLVWPGESLVLVGAGVCVPPICGVVGAARNADLDAQWRMGADATCAEQGRVCVPGVFRSEVVGGARTTTMLLECVAPLEGGGVFGQACSPDPAQGKPCKDGALCLTDADGAFCSTLCRTDRDCPADAYCVERPGPQLPSGQPSVLAWCMPRSRISGKTCASERDCAADQGCLALGVRSLLQVCSSSGVGTASQGDACSGSDQCRSTECRDTEWRVGGGAGTRSVCTGRCMKNSDCVAHQVCEPHVFSANGTPEDPTDDLVQGVCRPLLVADAASACLDDGWCSQRGQGDTCDLPTGRCYSGAAPVGAACTKDSDCGLMQACEFSSPFPGGACLAYGCDPAASVGVDACPAGAACKQRFTDPPMHRCYEACSSNTPNTCARSSDGYACNGGACMVWSSTF